jgi:hypothetical protein
MIMNIGNLILNSRCVSCGAPSMKMKKGKSGYYHEDDPPSASLKHADEQERQSIINQFVYDFHSPKVYRI